MADKKEQGDEEIIVEVFPRPPVVEAILSFRFPPLDDLTTSAPRLQADLGDWERLPALATRKEGRESEVRLSSPDGRHVLRLTRTSFSFHRLKPYSQWNDLATGAQAAWKLVYKWYEPEFVTSASLRYLNSIPVQAHTRLDDYFELVPNIPKPIDTGFTEYLLRLVLIDLTVPARAEVTQLFDTSEQSLGFDIEVISEPLEFGSQDVELWELVAHLRDYKNRMFFSSITEKCRTLFR